MYYFCRNAAGIVLTEQYDVAQVFRSQGYKVLNRNDIATFDQAGEIARVLNEQVGGERYTATDAGPNCSPRYDVIDLPRVGDEVSYGFNGDYYPDGVITKVGTGPLRVVVTSTGSRYYRQHTSGSWRKQGGTWSLVKGHISERNQSF